MKAVINGKLYNTETATEIAHNWNGLSVSDFRSIDETLFITKKGRFFLKGEGGPMTRYARPAGNMTAGGSGIIPLSAEEALSWCENHSVDPDEIRKLFGARVEEA